MAHKGFEPNPLTPEEQDLLLFFKHNSSVLFPKQGNAYNVRPAIAHSLVQKHLAKEQDGYLKLTPRGKRWLETIKSTLPPEGD